MSNREEGGKSGAYWKGGTETGRFREKVGRLRHPSRRGRTTSRYPNNNNTHSPLCGIVVGISSLSAERELLLIFRGPTPTIAATLVRPGSRIARRAPLPESLVPRVFMTPDP